MPFYQICLIGAGAYQLFCISKGDIECRVKAALITFGLYTSTLTMYLLSIGLPTPSHYGWVLLVISSFGNLKRLKTEQLHRNG
jgi:hypothetical protein